MNFPGHAATDPARQTDAHAAAGLRAGNHSQTGKLGYWTGACEKDFKPVLEEWNGMRNGEKPWKGPRFLAWLSTRCDRLRNEGKFLLADESGLIEEYTFMLESQSGSARIGPYTIWRIASKSGRCYLRMAPPENMPDEREDVQMHMRLRAGIGSVTTSKGWAGLEPWTQAYSSSKKSYNDWNRHRAEFLDLRDAWSARIKRHLSGAHFMRLISALCDAELREGRFLAIDGISPDCAHFMQQPFAMNDSTHRNNVLLAIRKYGAIIECVLMPDNPSREPGVGPFAVWQMVTTSGDVFLRRAPSMPPGFENLMHLRLQMPPGFESMQPGDLQKFAGFGHLHPMSFLHAVVDAQLIHLLRQPVTHGDSSLQSRTLTEEESAALIWLREKRNALREQMQRTARLSINRKPGTEPGSSEPAAKRKRT